MLVAFALAPWKCLCGRASAEPFYVRYWLSSEQDDNPELASEFLERVTAALHLYGMEIEFLYMSQESEHLANEIVALHFEDVYDNASSGAEFIVRIEVSDRSIQRMSPLLSNALPFESRVDGEQAVSYATAILLYAHQEFVPAEKLLYSLESRGYEVHFLIGNINIQQNDFEVAAEHFEAATVQTILPAPHINLAWTYMQLGETDEAIAVINRLIDLRTETYGQAERFALLPARAQIFALGFDYERALADMNETITFAEASRADDLHLAELYTLRGQILLAIYEWDRALADFNQALALDNTHAPALFQRGVLYYTMAQREEALYDFRRYLELAPDGRFSAEAERYIESIVIELHTLEEN